MRLVGKAEEGVIARAMPSDDNAARRDAGDRDAEGHVRDTPLGSRPVRPADRYGDRRRNKRVSVAVAAVLAALAVAGLLWLAWLNSVRAVSGEVSRYHIQSAHAVVVTVRFQGLGHGAVQCTVRALGEDHSVVGQLTVVAEPSRGAVVIRVVRTSRLANGVDVVDCRRR
jgi:hypothetical protein